MGSSFIKIDELSKQMIDANNHNSNNTLLLRKMTEASLNRNIALTRLFQSNDAFERDELYMKSNTLATDFSVARAKMKEQKLSDEQIDLLHMHGEIAKFNVEQEHIMYDYLVQDRLEEANYIFTNVTSEKRYKNMITLKKLSNIQNQLGQAEFIQLNQKSDQILKTMFLSVLFTITISVLLSVLTYRLQTSNDSKLTKLASTDVLTGLPNREKLISEVEKTITKTPDKIFALVFLDIDYFKIINDNYGHDIGDEILKQFSQTISDYITEGDVLSRFGGDEFVLLLKSINSKKEAIKVVSKLSSLLNTSFNIQNNEIFTSSSIGATIYSSKGNCMNTKGLLSQADNAMYLAKNAGRNCYYLFSKDTHEQIQKEHQIDQQLQTLLKKENINNQLHMNYQPLYDLNNLNIMSFEALIRWKNDKGVFIPPDEFIPIAEKTNLIEKINLFVINEVCKQKKEWNKTGTNLNVRINFNLSGNKKTFNHLLKQFKKHVKLYDLKYADFGIELTERTILEVEKETTEEMKYLAKQGLKILIDDFGTGYSSLSYLKKLPITTIKIDKSFISGLPNNCEDKELVNTIIALGNSFKLDIIAEGVETKGQLEYLQKHSCQQVQGYYLKKPLHTKVIDKFKETDYTFQWY